MLQPDWFYTSILLLLFQAPANATNSNTIVHHVSAQRYTKYITSPNWPLKYPNNCDIFYKIKKADGAKSGFYIELIWLEFDVKGDIDGCGDFVQVKYKGYPNQTFVFCSTRRPHTIYSIEDELIVHFRSDQSFVGYGFKLAFQLISSKNIIGKSICRHQVKLARPSGILSSMRWPLANHQSSCVHEIMLNEDETLVLNIMDFSMGSRAREDCNSYKNFVEIRGTDENKTFSESCPIKFQSSCEELKNWTIQLTRRHIFIHVNIMEKNRNQRGFLAGYSVNKKKANSALQLSDPGNGMPNEWSTEAVLIGAIMGVIIGLGTVLITVLSVSICMKRGLI